MTRFRSSGLGWADKIPEHWDVAKVCLVARLESGHTPSRLHPEYWLPNECNIPWFSLGDVWQLREGIQEYLSDTKEKISPRGMANSAARLLPKGTVVLSRTASVGFTGIMSQPMATTQDFANWTCGPRLLPEFLLYAFRGMEDEFQRMMMGSTHQTIYMPDIRRLSIPVPPREEQGRIVSVLRRRLPTLDDLIAKKKRQVDLLQEKRRAFITQAVTKGLDPNVPMKESGVAGLGKIPLHWDVRPLKRILSHGPRNGISPPPAEGAGVPSFSISAVRGGRVDVLGNLKEVAISLKEARRYSLRKRDLLLVRGNGNLEMVGACGMVDEFPEGCTYPDILMLMRPGRDAVAGFLVAAINSPYVRSQIEVAARTSNGTYKVSGEDVRSLVLVVPPVAEQEALVSHLAHTDGEALRLTGIVNLQVERLREYRQALITAAVTGKIDVSKEAA